jgi:hypothetical protein
MKTPKDIVKLTELFRKLGARNPEGWARSQIEEGIPQFQRFLFLRQAWKQVCTDDDLTWIDREVLGAKQAPDAPFADIGRVLALCLEKGISSSDLASFSRALQAQALTSFCYVLEDPNFAENELSEVAWRLYEIDDDDNPVGDGITMLHESVLETDPTGREVRPKGTT